MGNVRSSFDHLQSRNLGNGKRARISTLLGVAVLAFACPSLAQHIIPDHVGDPHFTSGPCPKIAPKDGAPAQMGQRLAPLFTTRHCFLEATTLFRTALKSPAAPVLDTPSPC